MQRVERMTTISPAPRRPHLDVPELWHYRELLGRFVWRDVKVRYKQTSLGVAWALLVPIFSAVIYVVVFGKFANFPSGSVPYATLVLSGLIVMQYFNSSLTGSSLSLVANLPLVTKVYFPRVLLPLAAAIVPAVDFAVGFLVLIPLMVYYHVGPAGIELVTAPLFLLLAFVTALGAGFFLSAFNVRYRDVPHMLPAFMPVLPLVSGVPYAVQEIPGEVAVDPRLQSHDGSDQRLALGHARRPRRRTGPRQRSASLSLSSSSCSGWLCSGPPNRASRTRSDDVDQRRRAVQAVPHRAARRRLRNAPRVDRDATRRVRTRAAPRRSGAQVLGAQGRLLRRRGGLGRRDHRAKRRRQVDVAQGPDSDHDPHGRVRRDPGPRGSLLEVGTGFHPELTGRENVFLNGSILGMRRREITQKLPDIIEFAGIEKFMDTPVKRYSSGMYVRLAFSVAAHLEPEILLVDEVLAVGDAEFQKRCLGRMEDFGNSGRTVVFVSHSMQAIAQLCERAIWLDGGRVAGDGPSSDGRGLPAGRTRVGLESRVGRATTPPGNDSCGFAMRASSRTARKLRPSMSGAPSGSRSASPSLRGRAAGLPQDQARRPARRCGVQRPRYERAVAGATHRASTSRPPGSRESPQRGPDDVHVAIASLGAPKLVPQPGTYDTLSFHVQDPGEGDRREASSPVNSRASCALCSTGRRRSDKRCGAPLSSASS